MLPNERARTRPLVRDSADRPMHVHNPHIFGSLADTRIAGKVRIAQLLGEASEIEWDLICVSETHAPNCDVLLEEGHCFICGRAEFVYAGVAILYTSDGCLSFFDIVEYRIAFYDWIYR